MNESEKQALKQPKVFHLAFYTSLCERFGFYTLSFLLVLFLKSEFHFTDVQAFTLFSVFTSLAFITPVLGGYLADNLLGIRRSIIFGLLLETIGLALLASYNHYILISGLSLLVIGVGFFKTGPTNLLARSYKEKDPRIDSGFTLFYMGINIGSFLAPIVAGIIQRYYGWHMAFLSGSVVTFISLIFYFFLRKSAAPIDVKCGALSLKFKTMGKILAAIVIAGVIFILLMLNPKIAYTFFFAATVALLFYFVFEIIRSSLRDKLKIIACLLLITMGIVFFVLYYQLYTSLDLFIERCVTRQYFGFTIPTTAFLSLNPLWILILSPILASVYNYLGRKGHDLAVTTKFPFGILIISLCFFTVAFSIQSANTLGKISPFWIVLAIGLYSFGELLVSALGVAMVTHISPKRFYGIMMGSWYLGTSLAASLSGLLANITNIPQNLHDSFRILHIYQSAFIKIGLIGAVAAAIAFMVGPYIKHIARLD